MGSPKCHFCGATPPRGHLPGCQHANLPATTLPPEVERLLAALRTRAIHASDLSWHGDVIVCDICESTWNNGTHGMVATPEWHKGDCPLNESTLRTAIARALGGDGEPVACRVAGTMDAARAIGSLVDAWDLSDEDSVVEKLRGPMKALRKLIDADALYTRPAATGDTGEVERAARTAALYVDEAWRKGAPKSEWHPIKAMLMRDAIRAATGGHPSEARRGHESEGLGGPDAR